MVVVICWYCKYALNDRSSLSAAKVVNWVNRFTDKNHVMESVGDLDKFAENNPFLAIGLFDKEQDGEL